jgi:molecular chaperone GrpE
MAEKPVTEPAQPSPDATDSPGASASSVDPAEELRRERDDYYDRWLRKTAEFENYRKRVERERREQADQAVIDLLQQLLLVADDFDRALETETGDADAYRKGVALIHAKLHDLLKKHGVKPIETLGADFDPNIHQAVVHEVSPDHRDVEVTGELRRGYMMGDRLLRPAMVKVAKA